MSDRRIWTATLRPGAAEAYAAAHREPDPAMIALLREAGIRNYTIFQNGDRLVAYLEAIHGIAEARRIQAASPVYHRWNERMAPLIDLDRDPATGFPAAWQPLFHHG
jgi:L-rhamnose mutarotase